MEKPSKNLSFNQNCVYRLQESYLKAKLASSRLKPQWTFRNKDNDLGKPLIQDTSEKKNLKNYAGNYTKKKEGKQAYLLLIRFKLISPLTK